MVAKPLNQPGQQRQDTGDFQIVLKFGGGVNSSASEDGVEPHECTEGQNFFIDFKNYNLKNRKPFDLMGTAPNGSAIKGFVSHVSNTTGNATMLVQAGTNVYQWSLSHGFVLVGMVNTGAKIRGSRKSYWGLTDTTIITDIALLQPCLAWDGSSLTTMATNLGVDFYAKYCNVFNERAMFANVVAGQATPHLIVSSKLSDYTTLSITNRPSSSLGADDPFYLPTPDLRPVNGLVGGFGILAVSTQSGSIFQLTGQDSTDIAITDLYGNSGAAGYESMEFVSNDILYGKRGRIESLISTLNYGDVLANDVSFPITDQIERVSSWTLVYNPRTQVVYCHPEGEDYIWSLSKILMDRRKASPLTASLPESSLSPWALFNTQQSSNLNPTAIMCCVDPDEGIEYVYFGDASGNLYRMEGSGSNGDGGASPIPLSWTSGLFEIPGDMLGANFSGYVSYRSQQDADISINLLYAGSQVTDETIQIPLQGTPGQNFWGGSKYWSGGNYWGVSFNGRFRRESFTPGGGSEQFQLQVIYNGTGDIEINEIGLSFSGAKQTES